MQSAQVKTNRSNRVTRPNAQPRRRVVNMDGNVAYVNRGFAKQKVRQPRKAAKAEAKHSRAGLGMTMFVMFAAFCALALLVSRYAVVCSIGAQNNALEQQIVTIEGQIDNLAVQLELKDDLEYVHNVAQSELGMKYPDQSQKVSISLDW
jgi:cell division protein FtsB